MDLEKILAKIVLNTPFSILEKTCIENDIKLSVVLDLLEKKGYFNIEE